MRASTLHRVIVVLHIKNRIGELSTRGKVIAKAMTGNAWIPAPNPTVEVVLGHIADLDKATTDAKAKAPAAVAVRKVKEGVVRQDLEGWRHQVQTVADANPTEARAIVGSTGMDVKALTFHEKAPLELKVGVQPGTITAIAKAGPKGVRVFHEYQYSLDGGKTWLPGGNSTDAHIDIAGLPSAAVVAVRYRTNHKNIPGEWSQTVSILTH